MSDPKPESDTNSTAGDGSRAAACSALAEENKRLRAALGKIAKWVGEFPDTGREWDDGTAMSYGAAFGSNGERDYMRQVAQDALDG